MVLLAAAAALAALWGTPTTEPPRPAPAPDGVGPCPLGYALYSDDRRAVCVRAVPRAPAEVDRP